MVQGKEPAHFIAMWQGKMVVYDGGVASRTRTISEVDEAEDGDGSTKLFQVRGVGRGPPYAAQVPAAASSLNSGAASTMMLSCKLRVNRGYKVSRCGRFLHSV